MALVPDTNQEIISFYESRALVWNTHLAQLGLTASQVTAVLNAIQAAQEAFAAQQKAKNEAKAATLEFNNAMADLKARGATCIRLIKNAAEVNSNPNSVYAIAQIDPPAPPSPMGPPGTPDKFTVTLLQTGAVRLSWVCKNPPGMSNVVYTVHRGPSSDGPFAPIGFTGTREFTDSQLPGDDTSVVYMVQGVHGETVGPAALYAVNFGTGGGGRFAQGAPESVQKQLRPAA